MEADVHPLLQWRDEWTPADVEALGVPDWWRYEIVDGSLVVSPAAGGDHELAGAELRLAIQGTMPEGIAVVGPMGVTMPRSYLIPDLVIARRDDIKGAGNLDPSVVLVAIEIVSPGSVSLDRLVKPAKYAAAGIANFWRVETDPVAVTAYTLVGEGYRELGTWGAGETARIDVPFPVTIELDRLA